MSLRTSVRVSLALLLGALLLSSCGIEETEPEELDAPLSSLAVTLTTTAPGDTNVSPIPVTATFSSDVTGTFILADVSVTNGTAANFVAVDGSTYTFDVTPAADGPVQVDVPAGVARSAGEDNLAATPLVVNYDTTSPTPVVTFGPASPTNLSPIPVTVTFNEPVTGFALGSVTVGNGTPGALSGSGTTYSFGVTPGGDPVTVSVDVAAAAATDTAGNASAAAAGPVTIDYDGIAPGVTLSSAAPDPANTSPVVINVTFDEPVTGFALADIVVGNGTAGNLTGSGTTYSFDVTPTADPTTLTVDIPAGGAQDGAGNGNTAAVQFTIGYDAGPPGVTLSSAAPDPTNASPVVINVTFGEPVTGFAIADIVVGNGTAGNLAGSGTTYSFDVTPTADPTTLTVDVPAGGAQDAAGNGNTAAIQFTIGYDAVPPGVTLSTTAPVLQGKTNVNPVPITVTFDEPVTGFTLADVTAGGGTAGNFAGSGASYTLDVTPTGDPVAVTVDVAAAVATDAAGNGNLAATQFTVTFDSTFDPLNLPPTISDITDKVTNQDTALEFVAFTANEGAGEDAQVLSVVSLTSSDKTLIPDANIVLASFTDNGPLPGASGELTITPAPGQTGSATITVVITDGNATAQDTFVVTVNVVLDPPVAFNVNATTGQDTPVAVTLSATDPGGDPIVSWTIDTPPSNGSLSGVAPNLTYTPDLSFTGTDSFTYYVTDDTGENSNVAIATIVVGGAADFIVADAAAVTGFTGVYPGDEQVYLRIQALGFNVTPITDDDVFNALYTVADADAVALVIVSSSVGSANIGDALRATTTPVMTWERFLYDAAAGGFAMTGTTDTDDGIAPGATQIRIIDGVHPLAGGLANGTYTVFTAAQDMVWAFVSPAGEVVADVDIGGGIFRPVLFVYEAGDVMQSGVVAPAKRVGYFLPDNGVGTLTADGLTLLDAAINEALAR